MKAPPLRVWLSIATLGSVTMDRSYAQSTGALGELEQRVMEFIWSRGLCTADECREALASHKALKESTVRTVLHRLEEKGYLTHEMEGRTFIYRATKPPQAVAAGVVKQLIDKFCGGSVEQLLIGMIDNAVLPPRQLQKLAQKITQDRLKRS